METTAANVRKHQIQANKTIPFKQMVRKWQKEREKRRL